jgi:CRP-like cAMP-binding protein
MNQYAVPIYRNQILSALPPSEIEQLRPHLQSVSFVLQQVLHEAGNPVAEVYFPESGLVSVTADTQDHGWVEVGLIGREGYTGSQVLLSPDALVTHRSFMQVPGHGYKLAAPDFIAAAERLPAFRALCLRYIHFLMLQTAQTAACNARHELPKRLARWLLMSQDRIDGNDLPMKQEFLSYMLGVRRAGVSVVVGALQTAGLVRPSRGHITILDRVRLEDEACTCYRIIAENREKIIGPA